MREKGANGAARHLALGCSARAPRRTKRARPERQAGPFIPEPTKESVISKEAPHRTRGRQIAWRRLRNLLSVTARHIATRDSVGLPSAVAFHRSGLSVSGSRFLGRAKVQCVGRLRAALPRNDSFVPRGSTVEVRHLSYQIRERVCHFEGGASPDSRTADRMAPTEKSTVGHGQVHRGARFRRPPVRGCLPSIGPFRDRE
jgi:hypothetical protein